MDGEAAQPLARAFYTERRKAVMKAKRDTFCGKINKTAGGLTQTDLVKNKRGRIVSKKKSELAKKSIWLAAINITKDDWRERNLTPPQCLIYKALHPMFYEECMERVKAFKNGDLRLPDAWVDP